MRRIESTAVAVAAVLALLLPGCGGGGGGTTSGVALVACTVQEVKARCGQLAVPENPASTGGRSISLRVVVIPASSPDRAPDALFYLAGGPGGAATDSTAWAYSHFGLLNQHHDIVLVDQRGTGGSNEVTCSIIPTTPTEAALADSVSSCLASTKGRADPRFYTTPIAVDDFDRVRAALGYDTIDLYGGSYGVSSGLDYLQRHGGHVRTALFDSGSLLDVHLWERVPVSAQNSLDELFARCAADPSCAAAYPNLKADFAAVTDQLAKTPVTSQLIDPAGGFRKLDLPTFLNFVVDDYLSNIESAASLPRDVHAAATGDWSAFMKLFAAGVGTSQPTPIMFLTIVCSDEWAIRDPSAVAALGGTSSFTPMSVQGAIAVTTTCRYWPRASGAKGAVSSSAPIVFLNGTADPADPPANVAGASATMPNSLVVPVPGFGHGILDQEMTSCFADRAATFIEVGRPSTAASWACPSVFPTFVTS